MKYPPPWETFIEVYWGESLTAAYMAEVEQLSLAPYQEYCDAARINPDTPMAGLLHA